MSKKVLLTAPERNMDYGGALNVLYSLQDICNAEIHPYEKVKLYYKNYDLTISIGYHLDRISGGCETAHIWCSPMGQLELAGEGDILYTLLTKHLRHRKTLGYLLCTSTALTLALRKIWGNNIIYLPPFLTEREYPTISIEERSGVICVGMNRNNKNYLNQYVAAALYSDEDLYIVDNSCVAGRVMNGKVMAERLFNAKIKMQPAILDQKLYYEYLKDKKLGLQVTYSESFNYISYELARMGIPSVVSNAVWWYAEEPLLKKYCVVNNIGDIFSISGMINYLLKEKECYEEVCEAAKKQAEKIGKKHREESRQIINDILEGLI